MNDKQLFEREYMGTFEPRRAALLPPRRPRLAAVLAALTGASLEAIEEEAQGECLCDGAGVRWRLFGRVGPTLRWTVNAIEAWELLAVRDLIPASWIDHPRRFEHPYHCTHGLLRNCAHCGPSTSRIPRSLGEVAAIASDARGIETAEALVGEHLHGYETLWSARTAADLALIRSKIQRRHLENQAPVDAGLSALGYDRDLLLYPYCVLLYPSL